MSSLISVIMPYYNKKNYFLESINSVLNQTYINLEVLIIYDDQNRSDLEYINNCVKNDLRVKIIFNDKNKGVAYSRNIWNKDWMILMVGSLKKNWVQPISTMAKW